MLSGVQISYSLYYSCKDHFHSMLRYYYVLYLQNLIFNVSPEKISVKTIKNPKELFIANRTTKNYSVTKYISYINKNVLLNLLRHKFKVKLKMTESLLVKYEFISKF